MSESSGLPQKDSTEVKPLRNRSRRRLLHGGLGVTPVLLTLVSRPVLAQQCFTPSGFVSMPTSTHGTPQTCLGRTPGFWKQDQKFSYWLPPYYPVQTGKHPPTTFNSVFGTPSPFPNSTTFLDALRAEDQGYSGPPYDVARHCVATLLNIAQGWVPVLTRDVVKNIWRSYINTGGGTTGYFEPTAGVKWYHADIVAYLTSTMTL